MHIELIQKQLDDDSGIVSRKEVGGKWVEDRSYDKIVYCFDNDEIKDLELCLEKFERSKVENFLKDLAEICYNRKNLDPTGTAEQRRQYASPMMANLQKTLAYLEHLSQGEISDNIRLTPNTKLTHETPKWGENLAPYISELADNCKPELQRLLEALNLHLTPGERGKSTIDDKEFCFHIAQKYHEHLGTMPTGYRYGPFVRLYRKCTQFAGLKSLQDPSKTVAPTIQSMKQQVKK